MAFALQLAFLAAWLLGDPLARRVVDPETGAPITGARVAFDIAADFGWHEAFEDVAVTTTDADGSFSIDAPGLVRGSVRIEAEGYGTVFVDPDTVRGLGASEGIPMMRSATLRGTVVGPRPATVRVRASALSWPPYSTAADAALTWSIPVDDEGRFEIVGLPACAPLVMLGLGGDVEFAPQPIAALAPGEVRATTLVTHAMSERFQRYFLRVRDGDGCPRAGARVVAAVHRDGSGDGPWVLSDAGITDAEGWLVFTGRVRATGAFRAISADSNWVSRWNTAAFERETTLELTPSRTLKGIALDPRGVPSSGIAIDAETVDGWPLASVASGDGGAFAVGPMAESRIRLRTRGDFRSCAPGDVVEVATDAHDVRVRQKVGGVLEVRAAYDGMRRFGDVLVHRRGAHYRARTQGNDLPSEVGDWSVLVTTSDGLAGLACANVNEAGETQRLAIELERGGLVRVVAKEAHGALRLSMRGIEFLETPLEKSMHVVQLVPAGELEIEIETAAGEITTRTVPIDGGRETRVTL